MTKKMILIVTLVALVTVAAFAQVATSDPADNNTNRMYRNRADRPGRWHSFDTTKLVDVKGKITQVNNCTAGKGRYAKGMTLTVADGKNEVLLHLGPVSYLEKNNWTFTAGETIQVKAFKGTGKNQGEFFAAQVNRAGQQLVLRTEDGSPQWRGDRPGRRGRGMGRGARCTRGTSGTPTSN